MKTQWLCVFVMFLAATSTISAKDFDVYHLHTFEVSFGESGKPRTMELHRGPWGLIYHPFPVEGYLSGYHFQIAFPDKVEGEGGHEWLAGREFKLMGKKLDDGSVLFEYRRKGYFTKWVMTAQDWAILVKLDKEESRTYARPQDQSTFARIIEKKRSEGVKIYTYGY